MVKSVIKEIFIIILLILAILLVLGVMFYDYRPSTKTIPTAVAEYRLSADIQEELDETIKASEVQNIIKTYYIDASDLKVYQQSKAYEKGKPNPFEKVTSQSVDTNTSSKGTEKNKNTSSGSSGNTTQGQYFNNVK